MVDRQGRRRLGLERVARSRRVESQRGEAYVSRQSMRQMGASRCSVLYLDAPGEESVRCGREMLRGGTAGHA